MRKSIFTVGTISCAILALAGCSNTVAVDPTSSSTPSVVTSAPSGSPSAFPSPNFSRYITENISPNPALQPSKAVFDQFTDKYCVPAYEGVTALTTGGDPTMIANKLKEDFAKASEMAKNSGDPQNAALLLKFSNSFNDGKIPNLFVKENSDFLKTIQNVNKFLKQKCGFPIISN